MGGARRHTFDNATRALFADRDTIRESGLWNVKHVDGQLARCDPARSARMGSSSDHGTMPTDTRTYQFTITFDVEPGHPAYDDPEWAADAAWGALTNEFDLRAIYSGIAKAESSTVL